VTESLIFIKFPTPVPFIGFVGVDPLRIFGRCLGFLCGENPVILGSTVFIQHQPVTDHGRTDFHTYYVLTASC